MTDKPDIEAIERREQAATKRPWTGREWSGRYTVTHYETDPPDIRKSIGICALVRPNDADFISRARDDIPDLLAYTQSLEAEIESGREEIGAAHEQSLVDAASDIVARLTELEAEVLTLRSALDKCGTQEMRDAADRCVTTNYVELNNAYDVAKQANRELEAENATLRENFAGYLAPAYALSPSAIASVCDEQLDQTGKLLGLVRARAALEGKDR